VVWAQADYGRNSAGGPDDRGGAWNYKMDEDASDNPKAGDGHIDWERWLGSAPKRPFSKPRFFQFRKFWDYSGGVATDLLYHVMAPLIIALDAKAPERACANGGIYVQQDDREVPDTFLMQLDFPDDYSVTLHGSLTNRQENPTMIRGHKATIRPYDVTPPDPDMDVEDIEYGMHVKPEREFTQWFKKEFGAEELFIKPKPHVDHMDKWLEAMRTRGDVYLDAQTAFRALVGIRTAVDAYRQDKVVYFDNGKEDYLPEHPRPSRPSKVPVEKA
jgi:predicted dehydrogenase